MECQLDVAGGVSEIETDSTTMSSGACGDPRQVEELAGEVVHTPEHDESYLITLLIE